MTASCTSPFVSTPNPISMRSSSEHHLLETMPQFRIYPMERSDRVDYARDEIVGVQDCRLASQEGKIAALVRQGFLLGGVVTRPRLVIVFRFAPSSSLMR